MTLFPLALVSCVGGLLLAGIALDEPAGPVPPPEPEQVGAWQDRAFFFDWSGRTTSGDPKLEAITSVIFRYRDPVTKTQVAWTRVARAVVAGKTEIPFAEALQSVPDGEYELQVRLVDSFGQLGDFSPALLVRVIPAPAGGTRAAAPTGLSAGPRSGV
ncbi:MAG TPA: hypothetical protein VFO09_05515 [Methyloceanibacter sp.]|nr:hypothetical protein [Methyloceanibacter sp.]